MKKQSFLMIVLFLSLLFLVSFGLALSVVEGSFAGNNENEVAQTLESEKIWIQTQSIKGSGTVTMDFRVWFERPPATVFRVLTDTNRMGKELGSYKQARTLTKALFESVLAQKPDKPALVLSLIGNSQLASDQNRQPNQNWTDYAFYEFNFPWPLTDRWAIQKAKVDETNANKGEYKYDYKTYLGNFVVLTGNWQILPVPNHPGWSEFRGHYEMDPGIAAPAFVIEKGAKVGFKKDVGVYRRLLAGG